MRTTVELPDELLHQAKVKAALDGVSLRQFFIQAVSRNLTPPKAKIRRLPPMIGGHIGEESVPRTAALTREQIDEAMFG